MHMSSPELEYIHRIIVACVRDNPDRLNRSELAKLLAGSRALEMKKSAGNRWNNRLRGMTRKSVTVDVDILLQLGYLALNSQGQMVLGKSGTDRCHCVPHRSPSSGGNHGGDSPGNPNSHFPR